MILQGTNSLSRGDFSSGVMAGEKFLKFLPIYQLAFERQTFKKQAGLEKKPDLKEVIQGWCPIRKGKPWKIAKPKNWFYEVFLDPNGSWIWCPPPIGKNCSQTDV